MDQGFIKNFYQNGDFSITAMDSLEAHHTFLKINKHDIILNRGEIISNLYIVQEGIARSYIINSDNEDVTTHFYTKMEIIVDEISLLENKPAFSTYQAITDMVVWKIEVDSFYKLFEELAEFRVWVRNRIIAALIKEKQTNLWMKSTSAHKKYQTLIEVNPDFNYHVPLKYIATYLGITDTSLSRIRREK